MDRFVSAAGMGFIHIAKSRYLCVYLFHTYLFAVKSAPLRFALLLFHSLFVFISCSSKEVFSRFTPVVEISVTNQLGFNQAHLCLCLTSLVLPILCVFHPFGHTEQNLHTRCSVEP